MRFSLLSLLLATPCFGLALVAFNNFHRWRVYAREMARQGKFVCGMCAPSPLTGVFFIAAGVAILSGRRLIGAVLIAVGVLIYPIGF